MITGIVRISYPVLFEAKENLSGAMKFSASFLISKDDVEGVAIIKRGIDKAIAQGKEKLWSGKVPKFRYEPLRDGDAELASGEKTDASYKGCYFINASANEAPGVVGPDAKPLMDQRCMYAGCYVRADINAYPYKNGGNNGVGWGLNNVMLVRDGERLDGRSNAEDAFAAFAAPSAAAEPESDLM
jgi:hypothetical protein